MTSLPHHILNNMNICLKIVVFAGLSALSISGCSLFKTPRATPFSVPPATELPAIQQPEERNLMNETAAVHEVIPTVKATNSEKNQLSKTVKKENINLPVLTRYTVKEGDLLSTISQRPDVYGDPLLWPLLYQANRDQIKDPRTIYVGQILYIPRNTSESEREEARIRAKKIDFFSHE